jgi:hypothetical protein
MATRAFHKCRHTKQLVSKQNRPYKLKLPTVDDLAEQLKKHGKGCYFYTHDLERAYGQLRTDPLDWHLLGVQWNNRYYHYTGMPFGARCGGMGAQRMAEAISFMAKKEGRDLLAYIDDYIGVSDDKETAELDFNDNRSLFKVLVEVEAMLKEMCPTQQGRWIGILFDSINMTMEIPADKLEEIRKLLHDWVGKTAAINIREFTCH